MWDNHWGRVPFHFVVFTAETLFIQAAYSISQASVHVLYTCWQLLLTVICTNEPCTFAPNWRTE